MVCISKYPILYAMSFFDHLPNIIAHRGAPRYAPENTIAGLRQAAALGARWVEFDVRLTQDHHLIVFHDEDLRRITHHHGLVAHRDFAAIAELDAGDGQRVPELGQWLRVASELGLGINIEIKVDNASAPIMMHQLSKALASWSKQLPQPLISSSNHRFLKLYRAHDPQAVLALVSHGLPLWWRRRLPQLGVSAVVLHYSKVTASRVKQLHEAGYRVLVYTVNERTLADALFEMGVDSVFTDDLNIF